MFRCPLLGVPVVLATALLTDCALLPSQQGPATRLDVPAPFGTSLTVKSYGQGIDLLHDTTYHLITAAPLTKYHGWFGPHTGQMGKDHAWTVDLWRGSSQKLFAAVAKARDGYEADLNEGPEFLGNGERSYLYARFEHKHFRWGEGVSFFSQSNQDSSTYVPNNGHLEYEVWGFTPDRRFTVVASVFMSHAALAAWGPAVRAVRDEKALKADRDYRLVETCGQEQFTPNLSAFDQMLDTLTFR